MTDDQLAYSVAKLKETGLVGGGDAARAGHRRHDRAASEGELRLPGQPPSSSIRAKVELSKTYTTEFVKDIKVLP